MAVMCAGEKEWRLQGRVRGLHKGGCVVTSEGVQRDLLPLIEGSTVSTKHGNVNTDFQQQHAEKIDIHFLVICRKLHKIPH